MYASRTTTARGEETKGPQRRITMAGSIHGVDYETFARNEEGHWQFTRETLLTDDQAQNVISDKYRWGGECRLELSLTCQRLTNGNVKIVAVMLLYEGASEDTGDLDGRTDFSFIVPRGKTVSEKRRVDNTDENGGDYAILTMTVVNTLVE